MVTPALDWPRHYPRQCADQLRDGLARIICRHYHGHEDNGACGESTTRASILLPYVWKALKVAATGGNAQVLTDRQAEYVGAAVELIVNAVPIPMYVPEEVAS